MSSHRFTPDSTSKQTEWLVRGLFVKSHWCVVAAHPSCGKSFFVEALAMAVINDKPFLGLDVNGGDVLIIDEDTPTDVLNARLSKFARHYSASEPKHELFVHSKEGLSMDDGSMADVVNSYQNIRLLIIDCLVSASGRSDLDKTRDIKFIDDFKSRVHGDNSDMTVIINHHISTKAQMTPEYAMTCENPQSLVMNNTRIVSMSDTVYILASPDNDGILKTLLVRPVARRNMIPAKPFTASLTETDAQMFFDYGEVLELGHALSVNDTRALAVFEMGEALTVAAAMARATQYFSDKTMREALHTLEDKGYLQFKMREGKGGRLVYERIM